MACGSKATLVPAVVTSRKYEWPNQRSWTAFLSWAAAGTVRMATVRPVRKSRSMG
jgi:hypothetical protein